MHLEPRDKESFRENHNQFLRENEEWMIEGNYSFLMSQRFAYATAVIWLNSNLCGSVFLYIVRTFKSQNSRPGNLAGATRQFSRDLVKNIIFKAQEQEGIPLIY